jgi:hypothetical protein
MKAKVSGVVLVSALAVTVVIPAAHAGVHIKRTLQATTVDADARGKAEVEVSNHGGRAKLKVKVHKLDPSATFGIVLGGVTIGTFDTNDSGRATARFSSRPGNHDQLLGTDPRGRRLEVQNSSGEDVLNDDIPDSSIDAGDVVCCIEDDDDEDHTVKCETRSAARCERKGGTVSTATSCIPDPCGSTSGDTIRCCKPDDDGAECEQTSAASCNEHHGVNLGAGACDPNPCTSTVPGVVRCCVKDDDHHEKDRHGKKGGGDEPAQAECEHLTMEHCLAEGGTALDAGSCDPNPCASPSGAFVGDAGPLF